MAGYIETFGVELLIKNLGLNSKGSFSKPRELEISLSIYQKSIDAVPCNYNSSASVLKTCAASHSLYTEESPVMHDSNLTGEWNVSAVMPDDGSEQLDSDLFFGSSSIDGAKAGFCQLNWDTLGISWKLKMAYHLVSWSYRAVTRLARLNTR